MPRALTAISILLGTIIGAGILGLPYVAMRAGFLIGALNIVLVAALMLLIYLYLGEISLRTKTNHHLAGYASLYLGKKGKIAMFISFAFGIYSALTAYLIGEGESLSFIFFNITSYSLHFGIAFWLFLSILSYFGIESLKRGEKIGVTAVLALIILIVVIFWGRIDVSNLTYNNPSLFYIPFGVTIFAFLGFSSIPEVGRVLKNQKKLMKSSIIIAMAITLFVYLIFTAIVLGSQGSSTPPIATLALGKMFVILGMLTMGTAYLALSTSMIDTLRFDFYISKNKAWLCTISLPIIIFIFLNLFNAVSFIKLLGIGGVISGGLTGTLILLMAKNAKKKGKRRPEYSISCSNFLTYFIILLLIMGTVLEILEGF